MHLFLIYYGIPNGVVWGNVAAEPLIAVATVAVLWFFRHALMRRFVAFHHRHKTEHEKRLAEREHS